MIGKTIRKLREDNGISRYKLSKLIGVTDQAIKYWEEDRFTPKTAQAIKLADVFDVSIGYLLGIEDEFGNRVNSP